ncbi:hypothetical protein M8J75_009688 [Diaphorina citri]|nr:hypothetical protein M8J75_009688 [Diaphorina citri]
MKHRVKRPYGLSQGGNDRAFDMAATKLPRDDRTMQEITMRQHELKHIFKTIVDCAEENNKRGGDPSKFEPYWNYLDVQHGLDKKVLHQGIFHVNPKEKEKGYVTPPCCILGKEDIHIIGLKNRNRAFEGDRVVVKILNTKNWVKDKHKKDAIKPTGRIVYILELNHPRTSMGRIEKLETDRPEFLDWKKKQYDSSPFSSVFYTQAQFLQNLIYYVKITSWMICNVAKGELVDVVGFHQNITGAKLVSLLQRELTSLIDKYRFQFHPYDTKKLKTMNKHFNKEYEAKTYVTEEDMLQRSDLTDQTVFTLSPHDRSPDDTSVAYSIRPLDMGLNEVQVHVSDVATYLSRGGDRPATSGTPGKKLPRAQAEQLKDMYGLLSKTAQYNCISVSTINRRISSLLPAALKKICALVPNEQKLALTFEFVVDKDGTVVSRRFFASLVKSVAHLTYAQVKKLALTFEFVVDKDGTVVSRRFFASLVKSVAHLTYAQVKKILDNPEDIGWLRSDLTPPPSRSKTKGPAPPPPKPLNLDEIRTSVLEFVRLSRTAMAQAPARLRLTKPEVKFTIVNDVPKRLTELDNLLGHWNFEVEKTAATRLITTFPHSALLVRQPPPDPRLLRVLAEFLAAHQIVLDVSDAPSSLAESWAKIRTQDPACRNLVPVLLVLFDQILQEPEFCTPFRADSKHYSLDEEYMTQFMSPLHNFSHIVVQKQLLMSLQISNSYQDPSLNNAVYIKSLADQHNTLRGEIESLNKKVAEMYLALQLGYGSNCLNCQAIVVAVYESSVDILVPSLYFVTTLYLDDYTVETSMQAGLWVHKVSWSSPPHTQTLTHLTTLPVRFNKCAYNFSVACTLRHPLNQGQDGLCLLVESQGAKVRMDCAYWCNLREVRYRVTHPPNLTTLPVRFNKCAYNFSVACTLRHPLNQGQDGLCLLVQPQGGLTSVRTTSPLLVPSDILSTKVRMDCAYWCNLREVRYRVTHPPNLTTLPVRFNKCAYNFSVACTLRHPLNQGQDGLCLLVEPQGGLTSVRTTSPLLVPSDILSTKVRMDCAYWCNLREVRYRVTHPPNLTTLPVRFNKCAYNFSVACTLRHPLNQGQDGLCLLVEPQGGDVEEVPPGFWSQSRMSASDLKALVNAAPVTTPAAKLPSAPAPPTEKPKRQSRAQKKKASAAKANTQSVEAGGNPSKSWFDASKGKPDVSSGATNRINDLLSSEIQMLTLSSSDSELDNETNVTEQREDANIHPPPMFIRPVEGPLPFNIPTPEDKAFKKPTPPSNKPTNNATPLNIDALISAQLQNIAAKPSDATPKTFGETPPTKTYGETSAPRKPSDKTPSSTFGETPSKPSSETFGRLDFTRTKDGVSSTADVSSRASPVSSGVPPVAPRQVTLSSAPYATDPPKYLASQTRETDAGASQRPANLSSPFKTSAAASPAQTSGTMSGPTGISASPTSGPTRTSTSMAGPTVTSGPTRPIPLSGPTRTSTSMAGPTNTSSEPTRPTPLSGPTRTSTSMAGPTVTSGSMGAPRSSSYSYTAAELNQQQQRPTNLQTQQQQRPNQQTQQQWRQSPSSHSSSNKKEDNCIIT